MENDRKPNGGEMKSSIIPFNVYVLVFDVDRGPFGPLVPAPVQKLKSRERKADSICVYDLKTSLLSAYVIAALVLL